MVILSFPAVKKDGRFTKDCSGSICATDWFGVKK